MSAPSSSSALSVPSRPPNEHDAGHAGPSSTGSSTRCNKVPYQQPHRPTDSVSSFQSGAASPSSAHMGRRLPPPGGPAGGGGRPMSGVSSGQPGGPKKDSHTAVRSSSAGHPIRTTTGRRAPSKGTGPESNSGGASLIRGVGATSPPSTTQGAGVPPPSSSGPGTPEEGIDECLAMIIGSGTVHRQPHEGDDDPPASWDPRGASAEQGVVSTEMILAVHRLNM